MFGIHDYALFVATGVLLNLMPGQDTFYIVSRSITQGQRIGIAAALGVGVGTLVHTFAAALGLSAILATSSSAFVVVKIAGAAYLIYLGVRMLTSRETPMQSTDIPLAGAWTAFRQGLLTNVLNPKVALFFLALMPQFVTPASSSKVAAFVMLGLTFVTTGTLWCLALAIMGARVGDMLVHRPRALTIFRQAAGAFFVLLGVRLGMADPVAQ